MSEQNGLLPSANYQNLIHSIASQLNQGQRQAVQQVNQTMVQTYWQIGKDTVEFEQRGYLQAAYGKQLLQQLARDLKMQHGRGFSRSNLQYMRLLYTYYTNCQTLSGKLSWPHYLGYTP